MAFDSVMSWNQSCLTIMQVNTASQYDRAVQNFLLPIILQAAELDLLCIVCTGANGYTVHQKAALSTQLPRRSFADMHKTTCNLTASSNIVARSRVAKCTQQLISIVQHTCVTLRMLWYYSIPARSACNRISQASSLVKGMKSVAIAIILQVVLHNLMCGTG